MKRIETLCSSGGAWLIGGNYLAMQQWWPEFKAAEETISIVAMWIWISGLYRELLNENFLEQVGNFLGKSLKIDVTTLQQT